jgi:hypothetical protein
MYFFKGNNMSQLQFKSSNAIGKTVNILAGWDNPCQWYFMVVEYQVNDKLIYTNLSDREVPKDVRLQPEYFKNKLKELGIKVPEGFESKLKNSK